MIMGFPGSTSRYMTSFEIDRMLDIENPQRIFIRGERQAILKEDMAASDKVRIQYASKYAQSSNYWKNSIGMSRGIRKLNVKAQKEAQEAAFRKWAEANTLPTEGYMDALDRIREAVEGNASAFAAEQVLREALYRAVEILTPARSFLAVEDHRPGAFEGGHEGLLQGLQPGDGPTCSQAHDADRQGEMRRPSDGVRRSDRQAVRRRYGCLCRLSVR